MAIPLKALYQAKLATPTGLFRFSRAFLRRGSNLLVLLEVAAKTQGDKIALAEPAHTITYAQLYQQTLQLAAQWQQQGLEAGQNIGLMGHNHRHLVLSLFALSALGVHCFFIPASLPLNVFKQLLEQQELDGVIYDLKDWAIVHRSGFDGQRWLFTHLSLPNVQELSERPLPPKFKLPRTKAGQLVTLSGGTTGIPQGSSRRSSLKQFLAPFFALLRQLELQNYKSTYIATPIYHGFGLAALLVSVALGATITIVPKFDKATVFRLLLQQKVQVWVIVPTLLQRLINSSRLELIYTRLILSGGAPLSPALVNQVQKKNIQLANLYGTSETGFCVLADTKDLQKHPHSIGKAIPGAELRIVDDKGATVATNTIGHLQVKTSWRAQQAEGQWVNTDDCASMNKEGYYFLQGRQSDRVVSGGINVYPLVVQQLLETHPAIEQAAVIGIPDPEFGESLAAYLVLTPDTILAVEEIKAWLQDKASKAQQPKQWHFLSELPLTAVGKVDKKALQAAT